MADTWLPLELTYLLPLAGLAALPLLAYAFAHSLVDFPRWQRFLSLVCRGAILVLLVLALAGLTWLEPTEEQFAVFVIDVSRSVDEKAARDAERFVARALREQGDNRAAFLYFAAGPGRVQAGLAPAPRSLDRDGTDLAAAIEVA